MSDFKSLEQKIEELETKCEALEAENKRLSVEIDKWKDIAQDFQNEVNNSKAENKRLSVEIDKWKDIAQDFQNEFNNSKAENKRLMEALKIAEKFCNSLSSDVCGDDVWIPIHEALKGGVSTFSVETGKAMEADRDTWKAMAVELGEAIKFYNAKAMAETLAKLKEMES